MAVFRLSEKISISIFLLIVFFGSLATVSTFLLTKRILVQKAEEELATIGPYRSYAASQLINNYVNKVITISNDPEVKEFAINFEKNPKSAKISDEQLLSHDNTNSASSIYILSKHGKGIAATDKRFLNQDYSFRDYFKSSIVGKNYIDMALGVTTNEMGYYFSSPIIASNSGEVFGVIVFKIKPEVLAKELFGTVPFDYNFSLVDEHGVVILSTDNNKMYKSLAGLSDLSKKKLEESGKFGVKKIEELDCLELMLILPEASTGSSKIIELNDKVKNKKVIATLFKIENSPFFLMVEEDISFLSEVSLRSAAMVASFVAIAALAAIVIIGLLIKMFLTPLEIITKIAKSIGEGSEVEKIVIKNNDEIGQLGEVINNMSQQLSEYRNTMEMKVKERTSEIEKSMDLMLDRELKMMELKKEIQRLKDQNKDESVE